MLLIEFFSSNFTRRSKDWDNNNAHWIWWTIYFSFLKGFIAETIWIFDEAFYFFPFEMSSWHKQSEVWGSLLNERQMCVYYVRFIINIWPIHQIGLPLYLLDIMDRKKCSMYFNIFYGCDPIPTSRKKSL